MDQQDKRPRECWIEKKYMGDVKNMGDYAIVYISFIPREDCVRLIEKSAYDELKAENERLKIQREELLSLTQLQSFAVNGVDKMQKIAIPAFEAVIKKNEEIKEQAEKLAEALAYQNTVWRKIVDGSMFTPESERAGAEKIINKALAEWDEFNKS